MASKKQKAAVKRAPSDPKPAAPDGEMITVSMDDIVPTFTKDTNPNRMSDQEFGSLVLFMKEEGAIQTVLVTRSKKKGKYDLIDGHHRFWAAQQIGRKSLPAIVSEASINKAKAIGIGLNRIRGELDLSVSGDVMISIMEATKWTSDQLSLLTGFSSDEIEALTERAIHDSDEVLEEVSLNPVDDDDPAETNTKPYVLEITFADKATYQLCRKKLRKAAGPGRDLAKGLLTVLGEDADGQEIS